MGSRADVRQCSNTLHQFQLANNLRIANADINDCKDFLNVKKTHQKPDSNGLIKDFFEKDKGLKVEVYDVYVKRNILKHINKKVLDPKQPYTALMTSDDTVRINVFHLNTINGNNYFDKKREELTA